MARQPGKFTRSGLGYYRWYKGRTRWVCGKDTPPDEIEAIWHDKKRAIDAGRAMAAERANGNTSVRNLLSEFFTAMEHRVQTGKPKRLSSRTLHNYRVDLNEFGAVVGGDTLARDIGPDDFARYVKTISHLRASGFDSKLAHVRTLFRWAMENEYIDRPRYGTAFGRPGKQAIRDERIGRPRAYTAADVAKLIDAATGAMVPILMLAAAGALNNSEIAWLERACVDLDTGVIDFRRRKAGRVRRVIPLPDDVAAELRAYKRPEPRDAAHGELFFLTEDGNPYVRMTEASQANTLTVLFRRLAASCGLKSLEKGKADGRGFSSLRTTFSNLVPSGYREEVEVLMGHAMGSILEDHYLETLHMQRLGDVVTHVWAAIAAHRGHSVVNKTPPSSDAHQPPDFS